MKCIQCGSKLKLKRLKKFCNHSCRGKYASIHPNKGCFKKGQESWNKGKKRTWKSKTEFKKGNIPWHTKPIGSTFITSVGRMEVKVAHPNIWKRRYHVVWESKYGKIPKGMIIHHKDRNILNDSIDNLELISRANHLKIHRKEIRHGTSSPRVL